VGIDLQLALVSHDSLVNDYLGPRAYHLALVNWAANGADPDLYAYWHSSQNITGFNYTGWSNPQADHDLQAAREISDQAERAKLYSDFQRQFGTDVPAVVLYSPVYTYATHEPAAGDALPDSDLLSPAQRFDTIAGWFLRLGK
jgi:peptide/nickel transport system substrate-binding protein